MVTIYTKPGCQPCRMSKRFLDANGIAHEAIDVVADPSALARITELGYAQLPVLETAHAHWSGFDPDKMAGLLAA